jgi:hypothetical protein
MSSSGGNKRQRIEEEEEEQQQVDVKLSEELRELMGGRKYAKEEELTRPCYWTRRVFSVK